MTTRRQRSRALAAAPAPILEPPAPEASFVPDPDASAPRLHYRGDRRDFDPRQIYGPDAYRGLYRVGAAKYDAETHRTTLYFRPIAAPKQVLA